MKLADCILDVASGPFGSNLKVECFVPFGFPIIDGANLKGVQVSDNITKFVTEEKARSLSRSIARRGDVVITISGTLGQIAYIPENSVYSEYLCSQRQFRVTFDQRKVCVPYLVYFFHTTQGQRKILSFANYVGVPALSQPIPNFKNIEIELPDLDTQRRIASVLSNLDRKIALNRQINANLEALAKQLYDYWFVQFDFPDANGKPYKSSGGKMTYNEKLKRHIPDGWEVCKLEDFVLANNTGDWGADTVAEDLFEVGCIRGADILSLTDLPKRYIKSEAKLLAAHDIVIEASGGSPTQATGRNAYITKGVIERNGGKITCSNFCHAFTLKDYRKSAYFYYTWQLLYNSGNMFNYEGKTSGIKNFMTEMFLKNYWVDIPQNLSNKFFEKVSIWYSMKDANIAEIASLTKQRDELLPLLMNGQATVE